MRLPTSALLLATAWLTAACAPESVDCPAIAVASVQVQVVDARGRVERDARVTYTVDGGPEERATCAAGPGTSGCAEWVASYSRPGHYVLTATSADGQRTARGEAQVRQGECLVVTERVTLTLPDAT